MSNLTMTKASAGWNPQRQLMGLLVVAGLLFVVIASYFLPDWTLGDFSCTFYPAAQYLLQGENIYLENYPNPYTGRQCPPFSPVWLYYLSVPLSVWPMASASFARFIIELAALLFLARLCAHKVGVQAKWAPWLIALAPWHFGGLMLGQWGLLILSGFVLAYVGLRRSSPTLTAIGLWLVLLKPQYTLLIVLAAFLYAYRTRMLLRMVAILIGLIVVTSLGQLTWPLELPLLWLNRIRNPDPASYYTLVLRGFPWTQIVLHLAGGLGLLIYVFKTPSLLPTARLWALLICLGLFGAFHAYDYDWLILMWPVAWVLRERAGLWIILGLYAYPFIWVSLSQYIRPWYWLSPLFTTVVLFILILFQPWFPWTKSTLQKPA